MKKISLTYCGMNGQGKTVTEAKQDATQKIEHALALDYTPRLVEFRSRKTLIWQTPEGIRSSLLDMNGKANSHTLHGHHWSFETVVEQARINLAQLGWDHTEDESPFLSEDQQDSFRSWVRFQRRYQEARAQGKSEADSHRFACEY